MNMQGFRGEWAFMSNFTPARVSFEGMDFHSVENAYQAAKTTNPLLRSKFLSIRAGEAKRLGHILSVRKDWHKVKDEIMLSLQRQKYSDPYFKNLLLATGDEPLVEFNRWHDNYWGDCTCPQCAHIRGSNKLGRILMRIRKELREGSECG
jgi:ribA/ribD-fused uncharacterized protein